MPDRARRLSAHAWRLIAGMALVLCPGCIILPIPHRESAVEGSRQPIPDADLALLECGRARREEVLLLLGQPDLCWDREHILAYGWCTSDLGLFVLVAGQYTATGGTMDLNLRNRYVCFEFDDQGVLRSIRKVGFGKDSNADVGDLQLTRLKW